MLKRSRLSLISFVFGLIDLHIMDAQFNPLVQALLTRMDHLEHRLLKQAQSDVIDTREQVEDLRGVVGRMKKAQRAQAEAAETARARASACQPSRAWR